MQNRAFTDVMAATDRTVGWAYDVWDDLLGNLAHKDNHNRAIAAQVLCNLARSDPELRLLKDLDALFGVTRDERFVTARHCLQALWKVGVEGRKQQVRLVDALDRRFRQCTTEKNCTLVRYDIIESLRKMYDATADETLKSKATELVALEQDTKYRKKYARLWRDIS